MIRTRSCLLAKQFTNLKQCKYANGLHIPIWKDFSDKDNTGLKVIWCETISWQTHYTTWHKLLHNSSADPKSVDHKAWNDIKDLPTFLLNVYTNFHPSSRCFIWIKHLHKSQTYARQEIFPVVPVTQKFILKLRTIKHLNFSDV